MNQMGERNAVESARRSYSRIGASFIVMIVNNAVVNKIQQRFSLLKICFIRLHLLFHIFAQQSCRLDDENQNQNGIYNGILI